MNRIKEVLEQKGIKQTWLAEKLGKSYNMVNAYAQNRQQPRLETLMEIAEILDVDVKELIISNKEKQMPVDFSKILVVGVSSRALFNLEQEEQIFREKNIRGFREYQLANEDKLLEKGLHFLWLKHY